MELSIEWNQHDDLQIVLEHAKRSFGHSFFMEVIIIACWNIWLIRNGKIFRQKNGSFTMWKCMTYLCYGIESRSSTSIISWDGLGPCFSVLSILYIFSLFLFLSFVNSWNWVWFNNILLWGFLPHSHGSKKKSWCQHKSIFMKFDIEMIL
jgi:hypothetical protein